ncbi:unnamed protein product [Closterium sp. Naga37s-1]|nr:unnamed protein product [Closterium sp. Naga37s-1]
MASSIDELKNIEITTGEIIAEYIWIGGSGIDIRSKARTLKGPIGPNDVVKLPKWNFDGSSTGQAPGDDSEVILYPQAIFKDPFRGGNNILVICDCYTPQGQPIPTNKRAVAAEIFEKVKEHEAWFGLEQEYTLMQKDVNWPLGWPKGGYPAPQGPYYCGTGADKAWGRDIVDAHYKACLYAGVKISGINAEVMPGQWEFQVGPCTGIEAGDHLWMGRYLLEGDWNGAGCHTNYSTKAMREEGGYDVILKAIEKLGLRHKDHIAAYGEGNERRLTGKHETADVNTFSWGVANRGCSVRVGRDTEAEKKGYFEDRRPASNMDPYVVTSKIADTTILWDPKGGAAVLEKRRVEKQQLENQRLEKQISIWSSSFLLLALPSSSSFAFPTHWRSFSLSFFRCPFSSLHSVFFTLSICSVDFSSLIILPCDSLISVQGGNAKAWVGRRSSSDWIAPAALGAAGAAATG